MSESGFEQREREAQARERIRTGDRFAQETSGEDRQLGESYARKNAVDGPALDGDLADADYAEEKRLGNAFADPNSLDDRKLGNAFAETNSSRKKNHDFHLKQKLQSSGTRKYLIWFLVAVVLLFALVFVLSIIPRHRRDKENAQRAEGEKDRLPTVQVVQVKREAGGAGLTIPGTTTPLTQAFVYARANGYLKRRLVDIGDHVRKDQLLAVIDSPDLDQQVDQAREQVRQAQAQVAQQQTQLALNKITWDRYRVLVAKGVIARQEGDQREADYLAQQANVAAAERNVQAYQANLRRVIALQSYEQVRAPFDGVVTARNVDVGALISAAGASSGGSAGPSQAGPSAGQQGGAASNSAGSSGNAPTASTPGGSGEGSGAGALFSIAQVQRLRILVSVPEGYAGAVKPGQHTLLHFQEFPNQEFHGDVTRTAASIDQNTRTLLTEVQVDNRKGALMSGMYAVVTFAEASGGSDGLVMIPGDALVVRENRMMVALVQNDTVRMQPVEIGRDFGTAVQIVNGLKEGDVIATTVTDEITDGAKVQIRQANSETQNAGQQAPTATKAPPGGSSQYGDQGITDANQQGQGGQKKQGGGQQGGKKPGSESKP